MGRRILWDFLLHLLAGGDRGGRLGGSFGGSARGRPFDRRVSGIQLGLRVGGVALENHPRSISFRYNPIYFLATFCIKRFLSSDQRQRL